MSWSSSVTLVPRLLREAYKPTRIESLHQINNKTLVFERMQKDPLEVLVFGTGAVGATFGWRVSQNPHVRLTTVCRSNFEAVKRNGIVFKTKKWGNALLRPDRVVQHADDVRDIHFDYVICANKIIDFAGSSFIDNIGSVIRPETTIVAAQNGFCAESILRQAFPRNTILSAICYVSCGQKAPGVIEHLGQIRPWSFKIGTYKNLNVREAKAKLQTLVDLDSQLQFTESIDAERWTKLIFNGAWNPTAAIYQLTTQEIYRNPAAWVLVQSLAEEIYSVAVASGIELPADTTEKTLNYVRDLPPLTLSTLQDLRARKPLEVEALCGSVLRQADQLGLSVPALRSTYDVLMDINQRLSAQSVRTVQQSQEVHDYVPSPVGWSIASSA